MILLILKLKKLEIGTISGVKKILLLWWISNIEISLWCLQSFSFVNWGLVIDYKLLLQTLSNGNGSQFHSPLERPLLVNNCTAEERKEKLSRYRNKRTKRNFGRKIKVINLYGNQCSISMSKFWRNAPCPIGHHFFQKQSTSSITLLKLQKQILKDVSLRS